MKLYDYQYPDTEKAGQTSNRYAQIHILFRAIAQQKLGPETKHLTAKTAEVKSYWKSLFNVGSLTELDDKRLNSLTRILQNRLETIKKLKEE